MKQFALAIAMVDEVHDEDHDAVLNGGLFYLFELFHVHEGVYYEIGLHLLLLSLFKVFFQPFVLH